MLMLSLSYILVTCHIHLLLKASQYFRHIPPITFVWFVGSALRVVGLLSTDLILVSLSLSFGYLLGGCLMLWISVGEISVGDDHDTPYLLMIIKIVG